MVRRLLKSDYTEAELKEFPDAPYWDNEEETEGEINDMEDKINTIE